MLEQTRRSLDTPGFSKHWFCGGIQLLSCGTDMERSRDQTCTTSEFSPWEFPGQAGFEVPFVGYSQKRLTGTVQSPVSQRSRREKSAGAERKQDLVRGSCCVSSDTGGAPWGDVVEQQLLLYSGPREFLPSVPSWSARGLQSTLWLWIFYKSNPPSIGICFNLMKHNFCLQFPKFLQYQKSEFLEAALTAAWENLKILVTKVQILNYEWNKPLCGLWNRCWFMTWIV